jgi:hypothetical protein
MNWQADEKQSFMDCYFKDLKMAIKNVRIPDTNPTQVLLNDQAVGGGNDIAVTIAILCNTSASTDATVNIYVVAAGDAAGEGNQIMNNLAIPAGESFSLDTEKFVMETNDGIVITASDANVITVTSSFVRV